MKQVLALLLAIALAMPAVLAIETSTGLDIGINVAEFKPLIWMCGERVVNDDFEEPWRETAGNTPLTERQYNYAFEGEQIVWDVLVMDKNKIQEVKDVYVVLTSTEGSAVGEFVVECVPATEEVDFDSCNARIGEEVLDEDELTDQISQFYHCIMTVESQSAMYDEYWVNIVAESLEASGVTETAVIDEDEYWFFNPIVGLTISDPIMFNDVTPGVVTYSNTVLIENTADPESGVHLEMFIGGQDFRPGVGEDGTCYNANLDQMSNYLTLGDNDAGCEMDEAPDFTDTFCYYAAHGAYTTAGTGLGDAEGYMGIVNVRNEYGILDAHELIGDSLYVGGAVPDTTLAQPGNVLGPNSEVSLTLKLMIPEPCTGSFSDGHINIYGEAI